MKSTHSILAIALLVGCKPEVDEPTPAVEEDPCLESGTICTFAGVPGTQQFGPDGIPALESPLNLVLDLAFTEDGTAYLNDFNNHRIRSIGTDGFISTVSGTGMLGDGVVDTSGQGVSGPSDQAAWNHPTNLTVDPFDSNLIWVSAWHNSRINVIDVAGNWTELMYGTGGRGFEGDGGLAEDSVFDLPSSVAFDDDGILYISDQANQLIRTVDHDGIIETIAGQQRSEGYSGDGGPAVDAQFHAHVGQAADPSNKLTIDGRSLYIADTRNQVIRRIDLDTMVIDRIAGNFIDNGETDVLTSGGVPGYEGDGGDALDAFFFNPRDVAVGIDGELYIADTENHCVRVIDTEGIIDTYAGVCGVSGNDAHEVPATEALLNTPYGIAVDPEGKVYIADTYNHAIRVVQP